MVRSGMSVAPGAASFRAVTDVSSMRNSGPVVLLHSGGLSSRQWGRLASELAHVGYPVLKPDFLGHGANLAEPPRPAHFDADVEATIDLLAQRSEPAHLVGHSYGGLVALSLAGRRPDLVRSIALYEPVAFGVLHDPPDAEGLADLRRLSTNPIFRASDRGTEAWLEVFVDFWSGPGAWAALAEPTRQSFLASGRVVAEGVIALTDDRTPASAHSGITASALLIRGERSPVAARRVTAILSTALPHARLAEVDGAGHMGPLSHGREVNELIAAHIAAAEYAR